MKRFLQVFILISILLLLACKEQPAPEPVTESTPDATSAAASEIEEDLLVLITPAPTPTPEPPTPTPDPTPTPEPTPTPTPEPTPEPEGLIGWTAGGFVPREETVSTETEYISDNLHITVTKVVDNELVGRNLTYYVTDIYLRDIRCLRTAAAKSFRHDNRTKVATMAARENAIAAISGDMFNQHLNRQLCIRNGVVYCNKTYENWEICLLYLDGTMETMTVEEYKAKDPSGEIWQAWEFGPSLLDADGHALNKFPNSKVKPQNPRSVIGYYEPGHYCFVTVDGRQRHSHGLQLDELARLMESLGCKVAFNLDGGESASLYWNGGIFSKPSDGGRSMADIVYVCEPVPSETENP